MMRPIFILLCSLVLFSCTDEGVEPQPAATTPIPHAQGTVAKVKGIVAVRFVAGATAKDAQKLVTDLGLVFKVVPWGEPLTALVLVPMDSEDTWIVTLSTYSIVKSADRVMVTTIS